MPRALNATFVAKKVFADRDLLPVTTAARSSSIHGCGWETPR
jgi:hypothetical protein